MQSPPLLQIQQLSLRQTGRPLLEALDLEVWPGERWVILGQNGVGKSTLLRTLAGLETDFSGEIWLEGQNFKAYPRLERARRIAWLPQQQYEVFGLSVAERMTLARYAHTDTPQEQNRLIQQLASEWDVLALLNRPLTALSGGEHQRAMLAACFAQQAPLLLLDEPDNHLDLPHQMYLLQRLQQLVPPQAALVVMHDLNRALRFASHLLLLLPGGRYRAGPVAELARREDLSACMGYPLKHHLGDGSCWWSP
jgi:iron complex transport system ATP-binding protein